MLQQSLAMVTEDAIDQPIHGAIVLFEAAECNWDS